MIFIEKIFIECEWFIFIVVNKKLFGFVFWVMWGGGWYLNR